MNNFFNHIGQILKNERNSEKVAFWLDIILNLVIIVGLVFIIRTYFISPFQVFGPSMCNTLNYFNDSCQRSYGEYLIVNKFSYQNFFGWQVGSPDRGDIIVFHPPHDNDEFYIKRVIGLPGDKVILKDGYVYIHNKDNPDGFQLDEPYLSEKNSGNTHPLINDLRTFDVPDGHYFVLGDNRLQSSDSRSCFVESITSTKCGEDNTTPFLSYDHIEGKAALILWPLSKISVVHTPSYIY